MIRKVVIFDGKNEQNIDITEHTDVGLSIHDKLAESLDEGQLTAFLLDREEEFTMFDSITFLIDNELKTYLISNDDVELTSKRPSLYDHKLFFVEPTKILEREIVRGFKTVQPTEAGATQLTLYDEIIRLRNTHPLEVAGNVSTTRLFNIPNETRTILEGVICPEYTLPTMTLREAIDKYLSVIDGIARLDGNRDLTIDFFNETLNQVALLDDDFNEKRRSKTIEFNTNGLYSQMLNVVNDNEFSQAVEIYPAKGSYTTIRADDYYLDFLKSYIPTPKNIYYLNRLYALVFIDITFNANLGSGDSLTVNDIPFNLNLAEKGNAFINNRVLEKDLFRTLDYQGTDPVLQTNTLWFEQGKQNIRVGDTSGLFDITTVLGQAISATFNEVTSLVVNGQVDEYDPLLQLLIDNGFGDWIRDDGSILDPKYLGEFPTPPPNQEGFYYFNTTSSEYFVSLSGTWTFVSSYDPVPNKSFVRDTSVLSIQDTPFQVHYQPILEDLYINVEKTLTDDVFYKLNLISNQRANIIDINDFANNMKGRVDRLGATEYELTHIVNNLDNRLNVGDYSSDNFIVIERETIFYKDSAIVKYLLSKNFNRIAQFFGVNSEVRQWDIPQDKRTITRNFLYKDYCLVSAHNDTNLSGLFTAEALNEYGKNTILETIYDSSTKEQVRGGYIITPEPKNVYLSVGSNGTEAKNLVFDFKAKDTQTVGDRIVTETTIVDQDGLEGVRYTGGNGEIFNLNFDFVTELVEATTASDYLKFANIFPELPSSRIDLNKIPIEFNSLNIQKSAGEIFSGTYQVDFFPSDLDVYLGDTFFKRNRLINENNFITSNLKLVGYVDKTIRDIKRGVLPTTGVGDETVTGINVIVGSTIQANTITIDETKNQYIVTVQELDGKTMWALVDEDDNILFAINQDPLNPKYIIQFDFTHERIGIKDFYYDNNVFRIVEFNTEGGVPVPETQIYVNDTVIEEPPTPTREDYQFLGWDVTFPYTVTTSITINALWQPNFDSTNVDLTMTITPSGIDRPTQVGSTSMDLTMEITPSGIALDKFLDSTNMDLTMQVTPTGVPIGFLGNANVDLGMTITPSGIAKPNQLASANMNLSMQITPSGIDSPFIRLTGSTSVDLGIDMSIVGTGYKFEVTNNYFSQTDETQNANAEPNDGVVKILCTYNVDFDQWACIEYTPTSGTISS